MLAVQLTTTIRHQVRELLDRIIVHRHASESHGNADAPSPAQALTHLRLLRSAQLSAIKEMISDCNLDIVQRAQAMETAASEELFSRGDPEAVQQVWHTLMKNWPRMERLSKPVLSQVLGACVYTKGLGSL